MADPLDDLEAILSRHVQIEKQQIGQRKFVTARKSIFSLQVSDSVVAIGHEMNRCDDTGKPKRPAQQRHVGFVVLGHQNYRLLAVPFHTSLWERWRFATPQNSGGQPYEPGARGLMLRSACSGELTSVVAKRITGCPSRRVQAKHLRASQDVINAKTSISL